MTEGDRASEPRESTMTRERSIEEERSLGRIAQRHHEPHACLGVDPIMGVGRRAFGLLQDGVECDAAILADRLEDVNAASGSAETEAWNAALAAAEEAVKGGIFHLPFGDNIDYSRGYAAATEMAKEAVDVALAALRKGASE